MSMFTSFHYCPSCSKVLPDNNNPITCVNCGYRLYDNPRAAAAIVLQNSSGEILLEKRSNDPGKNLWDMPGGFLNAGETFEDGARRELFEELGLRTGDLRYIGSYPDLYMFKNVTYDVIAVVFAAQVDDTQPVVMSDELLEYQYFKINELPYDALAFKSVQATLRDFTTS
jgi:ADP-ribose pyrophosphatase YjhB (NUDIX family)